MTVTTQDVSKSYKPASAMAPEAIGFQFLDAGDLVVTHIADGTLVRTVLVPGTDYTIAGDGMAKTGTITASAVWPDDDLFEIVRLTPPLQKASLPAHQPIPSVDVERQLDRQALVVQETMALGERLAEVVAALSVGDADATLRVALADIYGALMIGYKRVGVGAQPRSIGAVLDDFWPVKGFGARIDGATDDTVAFNKATGAADAETSALYRRIDVPGGVARLGAGNISVNIRKGQHLAGAGAGTTKFDLTAIGANTNPVFQFGANSSGVTDGSGQFCQLSNIQSLGGPSSAGIIDTTGVAGWRISDCMFSSPGVGVVASGGDGTLTGSFFDDGLNGVVVNGRNILLDANGFYLTNYQTTLNDCADITYSDCQFEYAKIASIFFSGTGVKKNILISGSRFIGNAQPGGSGSPTYQGGILIGCNGSDALIASCTFRNLWGYAVAYSTGLNNSITIDGCVFDGLKTFSGYDQSTLMGGVDASNNTVIISNCVFRNLPAVPVKQAGANAGTLILINCVFQGNTGGAADVVSTNSNGGSKVLLIGCRSDRALVSSTGAAIVEIVPLTQTTGFTAGTGTANKGAIATFAKSYTAAYAAPTLTGGYVQATQQAIANEVGLISAAVVALGAALQDESRRRKALEDAMRTFGVIN